MPHEQCCSEQQQQTLEPCASLCNEPPALQTLWVRKKDKSDSEPLGELEAQCQAIFDATAAILAFIQSKTPRDISGESSEALNQAQCAASRAQSQTEAIREFCERIGYSFDANAPVDTLCLRKACNLVEVDLDCCLQQAADQYGVPLDTLEAVVCDRFIFRRSGVPPCGLDLLLPENPRF